MGYETPTIRDLGTLATITRGAGQVPPVGISASVDANVDINVGGGSGGGGNSVRIGDTTITIPAN